MEDDKIIDLFWTRDQTAIEETGIKYGSRLASVRRACYTCRWR